MNEDQAVEPWRAAWMAFREAAGFDYADDRPPDDEPDAQWIAAWKAAAAAVETQQVRLARQDRDQLRGQVLSLAADLEESAARTAPSKKSSIESEIAIRLRKTAGPPS